MSSPRKCGARSCAVERRRSPLAVLASRTTAADNDGLVRSAFAGENISCHGHRRDRWICCRGTVVLLSSMLATILARIAGASMLDRFNRNALIAGAAVVALPWTDVLDWSC